MTNRITLSRDDAEKTAELLEGLALLLRSSIPDRLFELLKTLDDTGVYSPLRYDLEAGTGFVADSADEVRDRLLKAIGGDS